MYVWIISWFILHQTCWAGVPVIRSTFAPDCFPNIKDRAIFICPYLKYELVDILVYLSISNIYFNAVHVNVFLNFLPHLTIRLTSPALYLELVNTITETFLCCRYWSSYKIRLFMVLGLCTDYSENHRMLFTCTRWLPTTLVHI